MFNVAEEGKDSFNEHLGQALALKLNLKTSQQANEKVLLSLLKPGGENAGLKQTLQARAAVYGALLDPAWFCKNYDLRGKLQSLQKRRVARSMLVGAPLFSAQLGAHKIRKMLASGGDAVNFDLATVRTAGQFLKNPWEKCHH